ncbi:hypothetical protein IW261DRAFT_1479617 [Armillaria novae-zelandiae]|uniref:Uncharacterized protein n=1 Tax=Armillaria novae-zelandiae TaxID=153914 RepID=A0AA39P8E0_9AGAR|nr:hypothetical protein IW261DRAFT_1479617 [Armillaria novae-zelandiae]
MDDSSNPVSSAPFTSLLLLSAKLCLLQSIYHTDVNRSLGTLLDLPWCQLQSLYSQDIRATLCVYAMSFVLVTKECFEYFVKPV